MDEGSPMAPDLGIAHGSGFRDCPWLRNWGLPMAPELGIAHGSGIRDCHFWMFIVFVTNEVAMRDLDMMLPENFISR